MSSTPDVVVRRPPHRSWQSRLMNIMLTFSRLLLLAVLIVIGMFVSEHFLNFYNIVNMIRQASLLALISYGMTMAMLTSGIELSVGSVVALSSVVAAPLLVQNRFIEGIAVALVVGLTCGAINGGLIVYLRIPAFIATYAMMRVARGMALLYSGGKSVYDFDPAFRHLGRGIFLGIPVPVLVMAIVGLLLYFALRYTTWGRQIYVVGANRVVARFSGFNVPVLLLSVYVLSGLLSAIAGLVFVSYVNAAEPVIGEQFPLDAIAVVVIGGTPFSGGVGGIPQTISGALVIAVLNTVLNLVGLSSYWQVFAKGAVIIVALVFDLILRKYLRRGIT